MKRDVHSHLKGLAMRLAILLSLILAASVFHRIFSSFNQEITGAVIFIAIFSFGVMYYYFRLFQSKSSYRFESIVSVFFVLLLTIVMYSIIYAETIENSQNYFIEGEKQMTSLAFPDAFYFSVTTITTLGYGDITPVGVFRYIAVIEVLMGWIYSGSLVYFIVREAEDERRGK
jgi:potassium channel LctB